MAATLTDGRVLEPKQPIPIQGSVDVLVAEGVDSC